MRFSAHRLRYVLLAGVFLLAAVVAGFFGLARYRAGRIWQRILARNGVNLRQETDGITWSQSSKGRTVFTLHASRATPQGHGKWALHNAVLILYGHETGHDDRIYGSEFQYDQEEGVARALGEVHMDLQAPRPGQPVRNEAPAKPLGFGPEDEAANTPDVIHVRTSGLVYMRKLGIAATGQPTEFRYGGITCTSRGAEFDSEHSNLRLLADVQLSGEMQGAPFTLNADHAEFDRASYVVHLASPLLRSRDRSGRSGQAVLHLQHDGSLVAAEADNAVQLQSGTQRVAAPHLAVQFAEANKPRSAVLSSGVTFADTAAANNAHGAAKSLLLQWRPEGGLQNATADGGVQYEETVAQKDGAVASRHLRAQRLEAAFTASGGRSEAGSRALLREAHLVGNAVLESSTQAAVAGSGPARTVVSADELLGEFGAASHGRMRMAQSLHGEGHTRLEQDGADGKQQNSTGDVLDVRFAEALPGVAVPGREQVQTAVQSGHVVLESRDAPKSPGIPGAVTTAHAEKSTYTAASSMLELQGTQTVRVRVDQPGGSLQAEQVVLHQLSGDADARGAVEVTTLPAQPGDQATHVLATSAHVDHGSGESTFLGEPGHAAQLWQGASRIEAGMLTLNGKTHGLSARPGNAGGLVHAVFASAGSKDVSASHPAAGAAPGRGRKPGAKPELEGQAGGQGVAGPTLPVAERKTAAVTAARMDYDDARREAVFGGGVRLSAAVGEVTGERGVAFLTAAKDGRPEARKAGAAATKPADTTTAPDLQGGLERLVVSGDVHLEQPGRTGIGEQLTYTAATDSFALTGAPGKPPSVSSEDGSTVSGETLIFQGQENRIVVVGAKGQDRPSAKGRVHTEMDLKQP